MEKETKNRLCFYFSDCIFSGSEQYLVVCSIIQLIFEGLLDVRLRIKGIKQKFFSSRNFILVAGT